MKEIKASPAQSKLKLMLWEKEVEEYSSTDFYLMLQNMNLPESVVTHLHDLSFSKASIGKTIISIGKVILLKIINFVKEHHRSALGTSIKSVLRAAVCYLVGQIPVIGQFLKPVVVALDIALFGESSSQSVKTEVRTEGQTLDELAQDFFSLV